MFAHQSLCLIIVISTSVHLTAHRSFIHLTVCLPFGPLVYIQLNEYTVVVFFLFFPVRATQEAHHWQTDYSRTNRPSKYSYKSRRANIKQTHKGGDLQPPKPLQTNSACTSSACTNYHDFLKQQNVIKTPRFYTLSSHKAKLYTSLNKKKWQ